MMMYGTVLFQSRRLSTRLGWGGIVGPQRCTVPERLASVGLHSSLSITYLESVIHITLLDSVTHGITLFTLLESVTRFYRAHLDQEWVRLGREASDPTVMLDLAGQRFVTISQRYGRDGGG